MEIFATRVAAGNTRVLFIGGSNTVLKDGYVPQTIDALGQYFDLGRVDNLAIGNTNIGMGLVTALSLPPSQPYDMIFIEYCVNDYSLAKRPSKFAVWEWAFDAMLAQLRKHSPEARIYPLMFGRRGRRECPYRQALFQGVADISARHHAYPIDVDAYVHGLIDDPENEASLYGNAAHYDRPGITGKLADHVARVVGSADADLSRTLRQVNQTQAMPVTRTPLMLRDHTVFSSLGEAQTFKNSRYAVDAVAFKAGGPWQEIEIPGSLIQINFVSARNSGRILVAEEGEKPVAFDTLWGKAARNVYPFLIQNMLFSWKAPALAPAGPRKLKLRALTTNTAEKTEGAKYVKQFGMYPPMPPKPPETDNYVYLAGALFA